MSDEDVLLEEGAREHDNAKDKRKSFAATINATYLHYEKVVKMVVLAIVGAWGVIVLGYVIFAPSKATAGDVITVQNAPGGIAEDAFPLSTRFLVIGDYGTGDDSQIKVAQTFKKHAGSLDPRPAFVISAGDQVYEHGITSAEDPVLATRFEKMYEHPNLQVPWYITIGNHDCEGSINAMLQYAGMKNSLWYMPQRYYKIDRPVAPKTIIRMIVLDECDLVCGQEPRNVRCKEPMNKQSSPETRSQQYRWIEQALSADKPAGVDRMWKVVVGHWGVFSYAGNADTPELIQSLDPLLKKYKVHAYFSGHDHCMQHIKKYQNGWAMNYFVSGAGGYRVHDLKPNARANSDLVHAAMTHGFMSALMTRDLFRVQLIDKTGDILYTTDVQYE
ncbi:hypothetical protein ATCC90586_001235 [Pythium insidiosum]|nr:hypothetical protein ATCC90586_001235 [Pythium insidiosum]